MPPGCKTVLFLCTGNYYRSRFAEELFNHLAAEAALGWRAVSRGIAIELGLHNVGLISAHALKGLEERGITARGSGRSPAQLKAEELAQAGHIVALKETEHRPLLRARFPDWEGQVEYWDIDDDYDTPPAEAMLQMERNIHDLLRRLGVENAKGEA